MADSTLPTCALQGNEGQVKEVKDLDEQDHHHDQNKQQGNKGRWGEVTSRDLDDHDNPDIYDHCYNHDNYGHHGV